ncbi:metalloproteinase inhibitor 2-like [Argonauta hians]
MGTAGANSTSSQWSCWWNRSLLICVVLTQLLVSVFACSCYSHHPQHHFCKSEYVFTVKAKNDTVFGYKGTVTGIRIKRIFKGNRTALHALEGFPTVGLYMNMLCYDSLMKGHKYLIHATLKDNKLESHLCMGNMRWSSVTKTMRRGLAKHYGNSCDCDSNIMNASTCYKLYSYQVKQNGKCMWAKTRPFRNCWQCKYNNRCSASSVR